MKRFSLRPRILVAMSLAALLLPGCSSKPTNLKATSPDPALKIGDISEESTRGSRLKGKPVAPGSQYDTLWERMFSLYALPRVEHRSIDREVSWFINHPDYLKRAQKRAEPFLYTIVRQLEKQKMPGELALLPVVESAFQPHAVSPANAAGIWQFIPATGRRYGLKRSRSYDGRRDVYASTRAAIKYLKKLHNQFNGDWLLAVAAYNCGEGAVAKAIQRNEARALPTDFWSLDLPEETKAYVPRLLAVSKVFVNADKYAVDLHYIPNKAIFNPVKVSSQLDLALAADAADISLEKLFELNPGFKRQFTDVEGSYRLFVPAKNSRQFKKELSRLAMGGQFDTHPSPSESGDPSQFSFGSRERSDNVSEYLDDRAMAKLERRGESLDHSSIGDSDADNSGRPSTRKSSHEERWQKMGGQGSSRDDSRVVAHLRKGGDPREMAGRESSRSDKSGKGKSDQDRLSRLRKGAHADKDNEWRTVAASSTRSRGVRDQDSHNEGSGNGIKEKHTATRLSEQGRGNGIRASQSIRYTVKPGETLFAISQRFGVSISDLRKWNGVKENKLEAGSNIKVSAGKD